MTLKTFPLLQFDATADVRRIAKSFSLSAVLHLGAAAAILIGFDERVVSQPSSSELTWLNVESRVSGSEKAAQVVQARSRASRESRSTSGESARVANQVLAPVSLPTATQTTSQTRLEHSDVTEAPSVPMPPMLMQSTVEPSAGAEPRVVSLVDAHGVRAGGGVGASTGERTVNYFSRLLGRLESRKYYPPESERRGVQGTVEVAFTLTKDGRILEPRISTSSPYAELDQAAIETVRRLRRFQPIPDEVSDRDLVVVVPFVYRIQT